jgi:RNA polymerase sigma factor (TIGR02999 family)
MMTDVTYILNAIEKGDAGATEKLLPLVYEELRLLAAQKMAREKPGQTLQATALVHEAYIRLVKGGGQDWNSRGHFFSAAAEAMRRILVENARKKKSLKDGGNKQRVELSDSILLTTQEICPDDLLTLNDALDKLCKDDPATGDLVKLHYFAGLTLEQIAAIQDISRRTAVKHLVYARAWLHRETTKGNKFISG